MTTCQGTKTTHEPVEDCSIALTLDPHTCCVKVMEQKGRSVREAEEGYRLKMKIVVLLLAFIVIVGLYYLHTHLQDRWSTAAHMAWLREFYQKHAPEVCADGDVGAAYDNNECLEFIFG
jgi:hypothetical protein